MILFNLLNFLVSFNNFDKDMKTLVKKTQKDTTRIVWSINFCVTFLYIFLVSAFYKICSFRTVRTVRISKHALYEQNDN